MSQQALGYILALLDMVTYGSLPVVAHYFVSTIDPLLFGGLSTLIGSLPLLLLLKKQKNIHTVFADKVRNKLLIIAAILTCASITFFIGTKLTSGINTGLLLQTEPLFAVVLSALFLGEILRIPQIIATLFMVTGAFIVIYRGASNLNLGDFLILSTPVFNQIAHVITKRIMTENINGTVISAARLFYGGIFLTFLAIIVNPKSLLELGNPNVLLSILVFAFIWRTLDVTLWYQAIQRISLSKASAILPLAAAISFLGSIVLLKETPALQHYLGLLLIGGGLVWFSFLHLRQRQKH